MLRVLLSNFKKEYEWTGNKEAHVWLHGKGDDKSNAQLKKLTTGTARELGAAIYDTNPSDWWNNLWTSKNR